MKKHLLIVDDNEINRLNLRLLLKSQYLVFEAGDVAEADQLLQAERIDLMILDLALPPEPDNPQIGTDFLRRLQQESPDLPVIIVSGHDDYQRAKDLRNIGAVDVFGKPFEPDEVRETIDRVFAELWQKRRSQELERRLSAHIDHELLGESPSIQQLQKLIQQIAPMPTTVLIRGETGTGKELVARSLHQQSDRADGPFIAINCASMSGEHLELELFGCEKGALSGTVSRHLGWFERAHGGTLFLDEVAGLPMSVQARLLRVLEHGSISRLGGDAEISCDVRILCSTREDLEACVQDGLFRDDLYYRIHVVDMRLPPLRERIEDLPILAHYFLDKKALLCNRRMQGIDDAVMHALMDYHWPGNVRELENMMERLVVLSQSDIIDVPPQWHVSMKPQSIDEYLQDLPEEGIDCERFLESIEHQLVLQALKRNKGVKVKAGRWLGFGDRSKDKMRYLCRKYSLGAEHGNED